MTTASSTLLLSAALTLGACAGTSQTTEAPASASAPAGPEAERSTGQQPVEVELLAYVEGESKEDLPVARVLPVDHQLRRELEPILDRPYIQWVLRVGAEARAVALEHCAAPAEECARRYDHPAYFVLMDGGNRPKQGLAIRTPSGMELRPNALYVEIDPADAATLIPHEYGHVMMAEVLPEEVPGHHSTFPHTTGAITNDIVAFSEGWGIHFETLAADRRETSGVYEQSHRDTFAIDAPFAEGHSLLYARDLLSYAQSYRRYTCIKENCFAFLPRPRPHLVAGAQPGSEDLLHRWTDTTVDPARLKSLAQMVASEGVVAALFYRLATAPVPGGEAGRDGDPPLPDIRRYRAFFAAMASLSAEDLREHPAILVTARALLEEAAPDERPRVARILLEVLHYTPVFEDAQDFYRSLHEAGHRLDLDGFEKIVSSRAPEMEAAVARLAGDPAAAVARPVPELWVVNRQQTLSLPVFRMKDRPLVFDLNTAPIEFLMTVPGLDFAAARQLARIRDRRGGFRTIEELGAVDELPPAARRALEAMRREHLARSAKN